MEIFQTPEALQSQVQALADQRQYRKDRGDKAKEFLQSEFLSKYLLPDIEEKRLGAYPKPDTPGWEEGYRYASAKDAVYADLMTTIQAWSREAEDILKKELEPTKSIV